MAKRRFFYSGDVSIEHGGYFYCLDSWQWGYVDALRVTPCSDAGGPDNCFWLEEITINIRDSGPELNSVLSVCGLTLETLPTGAARGHALVDCHLSHGTYDMHASTMVQIGPNDPFYSGRDRFTPDYRLRASVSLTRLARKMAHGFDVSACVKPLGV